jgi:predicted secreted protein
MYLEVRSLKPATAFTEAFSWNQETNGVRVPVGTYELTVHTDGIAANRTIKFVIAAGVPTTRTLTQAQDGRSYSLRVGDRLIVNLTGASSYSWTPSVSSNQAVLLRRAASSGSSTTASFVAGSAGKSRITAVDNPKCSPQCASPSRLFSVSVTVTG